MSTKRVIIFVIIAAFIGVIMGGIEKIFSIDLSIFPFVIPIIFFAVSAGVSQAASKKKDVEKNESLKSTNE